MQNLKEILFINIFLFFGLNGLKSQDVISVSGGNATDKSGTVNYTVGQNIYITQTNSNGSVMQGIQRPYEISVITDINQSKNINLVCSVYPNPTSTFLMLNVENFEKEQLSYQLFDIMGKVLLDKSITENQIKISMESYSPSTYFLKISNIKNEIKTFKIIKN